MEGKKRTPVWLRILLVLMALILAVCTAAVILVNVQRNDSERRGVLPELAGYKYCPVDESRLGPDYPQGAMLLVRRAGLYQPGDLLLILNHAQEYPEQALHGRYLAVRMTVSHGNDAAGETPDGQELDFYRYEIVGKITAVVPGLGSFYGLLLDFRGVLFFVAIPLVLTALFVSLACTLRREGQAAASCQPPAIGRIPGKTPPPPGRGSADDPYAAVFDVSQPASGEAVPPEDAGGKRGRKLIGRNGGAALSEVDQLDLFAAVPDSRPERGAAVRAFPEAAAPPPVQGETPAAGEAAGTPEPPEAGAAPAAKEQPSSQPGGETAADSGAPSTDPSPSREEKLGDTIEFDPIRPDLLKAARAAAEAPSPPPPPQETGEDAAVAIYREGEREFTEETFAPLYVRRPIGESLEEFKAFLKESQPKTQVDIVLDGQLSGLDEEKKRQLEKISAFDPDKAIEEIKRRNALYEKSLRTGGVPVAIDLQLTEAAPPPPKKHWEHPAAHRWTGVYRPRESFYEAHARREETPALSADEIIRLHRQDYADRRFRPSFITVVGEEDEELHYEGEPGRCYHNRNDTDEI